MSRAGLSGTAVGINLNMERPIDKRFIFTPVLLLYKAYGGDQS